MSTDAAEGYETAILARVLAKDQEEFSPQMAKYVLSLGFSKHDKERMHELAVRNRNDGLSHDEKQELVAYAKAGTVLSILKSKARRVLKIKPKKRVAV